MQLADADVRQVARTASGRPDAPVADWSAAQLPVENLTTAGLARVTGTFTDGTTWSLFVKSLQPVWASPVWSEIPEAFRSEVAEELDWLDEPRVYRSGLADALPDGLRFPALFRLDEGDERITMWMEDVADHGRWDADRYHRTAALLGRLGARWPEPSATAELGMDRRSFDRLFFGKISHLDLVVQRDDAFWRQPAVAAAVDDRHRTDLGRLAEAAPALLRRLDEAPHGMAHGDAAPGNFREPGDGTVVAIDWSYGSVAPLGSDLSQLVAGRFESGEADPADLPTVTEAALDGYLEGSRGEGRPLDPASLEEVFVAALAIRTVFSLLLVDPRPDRSDDDLHRLLARRAALARFGLDLALRR